jgi:GYF domain 2
MSRLWHYVQNGKAEGPVPEEQLRAQIATGSLKPTDLVWREGMPSWTAIQVLPELAAAPVAQPVAAAQAAPNPYGAPQANVSLPIQLAAEEPGQVSAEAVEALRKTKPWVRFMGVLGAIMIALIVLGALAMALLSGGPFRYMGLAARIGVAVLYLIMAALHFPPVIFLHRYANRIGDLLDDPSALNLGEALRAQKSFWKYIGLFTLIMVCIYILALVGVLIAAVLAGRGRLL